MLSGLLLMASISVFMSILSLEILCYVTRKAPMSHEYSEAFQKHQRTYSVWCAHSAFLCIALFVHILVHNNQLYEVLSRWTYAMLIHLMVIAITTGTSVFYFLLHILWKWRNQEEYKEFPEDAF